jgi:hypothetical protein
MKKNERITGANKSQTVHEGWGRRGNLGFPTDDRIFLNGMKKNEIKIKLIYNHVNISIANNILNETPKSIDI